MITLLRRGLWVLALIIFNTSFSLAQQTYFWTGTQNNSWTNARNWSPDRETASPADILIFEGGSDISIMDVPTQTVATLQIGLNTHVEFQTSGPPGSLKTLTAGSFSIDEGGVAKFLNNEMAIIDVNVSGTAHISGSVIMEVGSFRMLSGLMVLNSASPLQRTSGQFVLNFVPNSAVTLQFGTGDPGVPTIALNENVFLTPPTVSQIVMNNPNGATLANQPITVRNQILLVSGKLISNAAGRIQLASTASQFTETFASSIEGYVQLTKNVGTEGLNFIGVEMQPGPDNLGNVTIVRETGRPNNFNFSHSIAATWSITSDSPPVSGRALQFSWVEAYDNGSDPIQRFQVYSDEGGTGWQAVGSLAPLDQTSPVRRTASVVTNHFSQWTVADESNPLPVTWVDFYGVKKDRSIELTWKTGTEENTDLFVVEKMGRDKTFFTIGERKAAENSRSIKTYKFVDGEPSYGLNYYRIKQVDLDEKFSYSKIIAVNYDIKGINPYKAYPIPTASNLTVERTHHSMGGEVISLLDQFGREVYAAQWSDENKITVDDLSLPAGVYQLVISGNGMRYAQRVVIE